MHVKNSCKDLKRYPQISRRVRDTLARLFLKFVGKVQAAGSAGARCQARRQMRPLLLCFCLALASCCWPASAEGSASTAAPARAAPAIFALHPARGSRPRTVGDDESATSFVLRGARQLRMSLFALTRRLPLLPCCGAASDDPTVELLTAADIDIAR